MPLVTMPDGTVVNMPDQLDPALGARLRAFQQAEAAKLPPRDFVPGQDSLENFVPAPTDAGHSGFVNGAKVNVASGPQFTTEERQDRAFMRGAADLVFGLPEAIGAGAYNTAVAAYTGVQSLVDPTVPDSARFLDVELPNRLYKPQGEHAQNLVENLGDIFSVFSNTTKEAGNRTLDATGSPLLATAVEMAPATVGIVAGGAAPARLGNKLAAPRPAPGPAKPTAPQHPSVTAARDAGLKVLPSDVERLQPGTNAPGRFAERVGPSDLRRDLTLENQGRINELAAEELGAAPGTVLDDTALDALEQPHVEVYKQAERGAAAVPNLPELDAAMADAVARIPKLAQMARRGERASITEALGALRRRGAKAAQSEDRATELAGYEDMDAADRLENAFGAQLEAAGERGALALYQDARQALAKINDVRQTQRAGMIDPQLVRKRAQRAPLTGRMKVIADAAEGLPDMRSSMSVAGKGETPQGKAGVMDQIRDLGAALVRKIPGLDLDVLDDAIQNKFGTPALGDYLADYGKPAPTRAQPAPAQGDMFGGPLDLRAPPGEVGRPPAPPLRDLGPQEDMLGDAFDLMVPGEVGRMPMSELTPGPDYFGGLLDLEPPPGRAGKKRTPAQNGGPPEDQPLGAALTSPGMVDDGTASGMRATGANEPSVIGPALSETQTVARRLLDAIENPGAGKPRDAIRKAADELSLRAAELPRPVRLSLQNLRELLSDAQTSTDELLDALDGISTDIRQYTGE